uniref:Uncharacterized protein n=1 Tax=Endocarpon pusillum TaxID=364733 RepID=F8QX48_9EURO|nr:hypothetical protein [Endocarpon pusillum]
MWQRFANQHTSDGPWLHSWHYSRTLHYPQVLMYAEPITVHCPRYPTRFDIPSAPMISHFILVASDLPWPEKCPL